MGGGFLANLNSVSAVKSPHLRMFWYVRLGYEGGCRNEPTNLMVICRWSEFIVFPRFQTEPSDRWEVTVVRSGEKKVPS